MRETAASTPYTRTGRSIGSEADCTAGFVLREAKAGRVPHVIASNGTRLYPDEAVAIVKKLKAAALARRGGSYGRVAAAAPG